MHNNKIKKRTSNKTYLRNIIFDISVIISLSTKEKYKVKSRNMCNTARF